MYTEYLHCLLYLLSSFQLNSLVLFSSLCSIPWVVSGSVYSVSLLPSWVFISVMFFYLPFFSPEFWQVLFMVFSENDFCYLGSLLFFRVFFIGLFAGSFFWLSLSSISKEFPCWIFTIHWASLSGHSVSANGVGRGRGGVQDIGVWRMESGCVTSEHLSQICFLPSRSIGDPADSLPDSHWCLPAQFFFRSPGFIFPQGNLHRSDTHCVTLCLFVSLPDFSQRQDNCSDE